MDTRPPIRVEDRISGYKIAVLDIFLFVLRKLAYGKRRTFEDSEARGGRLE